MARRALILVEGHRGNGPLYVQAAQRLGLHPITLSADPGRYEYLANETAEAIRVDTDQFDALTRECSRLGETYQIAGITGFSGDDELAYAMVAKLCQHFNLSGPEPASVERCCDKFAQRRFLAGAGVPIPAYHVAANAPEVKNAAAEIGLPVVLKPATGSGSVGVRLCRNFEELAEHTSYLLGGMHVWRASPSMLVEEFAEGRFYYADTMGNELFEIGVAEFGPPPHFVIREFTYPAPVNEDEYERISDISLSCLQALGLGWGPTNIEFRWTKRGPVVIEVNPRLGGSPASQLSQLAYGVDLITEHIKLVTGVETNLRRRRSHAAAARYLLPDRDGNLDWIDGGGRAAAVSGVAEVKFYVNPMTPIVRKGDYRDRIGHVVAVSPSLAQAEAILERAVDLIKWSISPFPTSGEHEESVGARF
ncbi:conserved hypothetical protein [Mesorhizobium prunaredense]|uniref:ATP-grasp domain-containing protein n=1 Tax=Mesorhizobium prunaredense TaxID=1631249 RepID=A0A1R3V801_9HYPH|nr:acetyl-CoA carboxylase biotin carboxylase subunit family protein [Mesorhizobium prunaredense]SIT56036.1 conserved hypothetical protein [Mesorhizobium prunaredense]